MKCPYRKTIKTVGNKTIEEFAECYGVDCPYFGRDVLKHRYEGGFTTVTLPECRKVFSEIEEKE